MNTTVSQELHLHNAVVGNCEVLDYNNEWSQVSYSI